MTEVIHLTEDLLIGKGAHKKVYTDPTDADRCIKIPHTAPDADLERELQYRRARAGRNRGSKMLPAYYGTVRTNLGTGYVFERVQDFDGKTSRTISQILAEASADRTRIPFAETVMQKFKTMLFEELIVTSNMEAVNFAVQRLSETEFTIRVTDNIGSPVFIPLAYYVDYFARRRVKRYWARFLNQMRKKYPSVMTEDLKNKLL